MSRANTCVRVKDLGEARNAKKNGVDTLSISTDVGFVITLIRIVQAE
jgi:hypothetical protein